jgi:two-component system KDP operon response regulator KdpE
MPATDTRPGTKTILVIDDDADFTATVRSILEREGYTVVEADSGAEGLRQLKACDPDLVILDVMMESPTEGYGINEAIKYSGDYDAFQQTPIIMVSSIQESPDDRFPRAAEVDMIRPDRYLTKPLDIPKFLEIVRKVARH